MKFSSARDVQVVEPQNEQGYLIGPLCKLWGAHIAPTLERRAHCPLPAELPVHLRHHTSAADNGAFQYRQHRVSHTALPTFQTPGTST